MSDLQSQKTFFGHPRGLATLFFTEMFERFSYYGMRALLLLFITAAIAEGGLGIDEKTGGAIYGLYTMGVYIFALPGGWVADRLLGLKKSVWYGGIIIALGHFTMAIPGIINVVNGVENKGVLTDIDIIPFFLGLIFIAIGTGLLKPNISSMVGSLYPKSESARRDAGFSIFYAGINLGAFLAPIITAYLGQKVNWHLGFGAAGIFMVLGLIQYKFTLGYLDGIGDEPMPTNEKEQKQKKSTGRILQVVAVVTALFLTLAFTGIIPVNAISIANLSGVVILLTVFCFLIYVMFFGGVTPDERNKTIVIAIVFVFSALFWSGFEQAGSTLNLFAENFTDLNVFGVDIASGTLQSVNPMFLIIFAPIFGAMWIRLALKNLEPSSPIKFALGLILLGVGFLIMYFASLIAASGELAAPTWLIFTYMFHTFGELSLSPVGLSLITKLAPKKFYGQMMGIWFMSVSFGNLIAGLLAGEISGESDQALKQMPDQYLLIVYITIGSGLVLALFSKPIRKLMGDVH